MAQTTFTNALTVATEGAIAYGRENADIHTKVLDQTGGAGFGLMLCATASDEKTMGLPYSNSATAAGDGALVASNSVAVSVVVNGVTTVLTATVYATSHAATMAAIETKLEAVSGIASATVTSNSIAILGNAETDVHFSVFTVTLGGGQAVFTLSNTCTKNFYGPTVQAELEPQSDGTIEYDDEAAVALLQKGYMWMPTLATLAPRDTVYVTFHGSNRGKITSSAGSAPVLAISNSQFTIKRGVTGAGLVIAAINQP